MEKFDLQPTTENLKEAIIHDTTGRNDNVFHFLEMLNKQDGSWSVAIDGKWGIGKTFFVKQCQMILDNISDGNENHQIINPIVNGRADSLIKNVKYKTVYYDAWKNDGEDDPIIPLSKSIASADSIMTEKIKKDGIKTLKNLVKIAAKSIAHVDIDNYIDSLGSGHELSSEEQFNNVLTELIPENGRLVIFVDELDRCQPTYAIKLLERIKHFFNNDKITFVFSVNLFELKNTVQSFYGNNFDGNRYLDRFFDFVIPLPDANLKNYYKQNANFPNDDTMVADAYYQSVAKYFNLSLREINHFYSMLNTAIFSFNVNDKDYFIRNEDASKFIVVVFIVPYLIGLKIINKGKYTDLINGNLSNDFVHFFANNSEFNRFFNKNFKPINESIINKIYEGIFVDDSDIKINDGIKISDKFSFVGPNGVNLHDYKKLINDVLSLVSDYSNY